MFFSLSDGSGLDKNVIIFGVNNSSCVHTDKRKKGILTFGKGIADCLLDHTITEEVQYSNKSIEWQQQKFPEFALR